MNGLSAAKGRFSALSEIPTVHASSGLSIWPGFEFLEIETPRYGTFDARSPHIVVNWVLGPIKARIGGPHKPFKDFPTHPLLILPGDAESGAWQGVQRARHLFIDPGAFERTTHQPFRRGMLRLPSGPNPAIEQLLRVLHMDTIAGHPSGPILGECIISSILHQITSQSRMMFAGRPIGHLSRSEFGRVYELIEVGLGGSLSLEGLAASVGCSVRHLCRSFRSSSGVSLHQYILSRRVERAKALISKSEQNLEEIAEAVGFAHHAHMAATFRRLTGATPAQFRNRQMSRGGLE